MKVAAADIQTGQHARQIRQAPGYHVAHTFDRFQVAIDAQHLRLHQGPSLPLGQVVPDNHIDQAEFIFEREEYDAAGGLRPLPANHQAGDADRPAVLDRQQIMGTAQRSARNASRSMASGCGPRVVPSVA
jgi:hypothetical protein